MLLRSFSGENASLGAGWRSSSGGADEMRIASEGMTLTWRICCSSKVGEGQLTRRAGRRGRSCLVETAEKDVKLLKLEPACRTILVITLLLGRMAW